MCSQNIIKTSSILINGLINIDGDNIYINIKDGPQDVKLVDLLADLDNRVVNLSFTYDEAVI